MPELVSEEDLIAARWRKERGRFGWQWHHPTCMRRDGYACIDIRLLPYVVIWDNGTVQQSYEDIEVCHPLVQGGLFAEELSSVS